MTIRVEHWGTSVVANYGDLLYPLILERALERAVPDAVLSYADPIGGVAPMGLHHQARRALRHQEPEFWEQADGVDALVIGGGDLLHPGTTVVQHEGAVARIENWSFVEAGLLGEVRPVAWNALGVPFDIPPDLAPALRAACAPVALLTVRDEGSRRRLEAAGVDQAIEVVPDTAVLIDDVITEAERLTALDSLRGRGEIPPSGPLLVAHASFTSPVVLAELAGALRACVERHPDLHVVLLPIGPAHDDVSTLRGVAEQLGHRSWLVPDPSVVEISAVLGAATTVASTSYHATLIASVYGVPCLPFAHYGHRPAKLEDLADQLDRSQWLLDRPSAIPAALDAVLAGSGGTDASDLDPAKVRASAHLDRIAEVVTRPAPLGVDLRERGRAHRHSLTQLAAAEASLDRARQDLEVLREHHTNALRRARMLEVGYWRERDRQPADGTAEDVRASVIDLDVIDRAELRSTPYRWGHVGPLGSPADLARLAETVPLETAEIRASSDGRRSWSYKVRCLVDMGGRSAVRPQELDPVWRSLADDLAGDEYRAALTRLTGVDLSDLTLEANVFSYTSGGYQEPHPDLPEKVVTHVLWFNEGWQAAHGGCLRILNTADEQDVHTELLPELGWSAVFVRSDSSWHSVTAVTDEAPVDRRAVVATFHRPGSPSTMWPNGV